MRKEQGITLISLVVTIIVLIILAGVSIGLLLNEDGIITKAREAKQNIELAQIEEQEKLNELYEQMIGEGSGSISYDAIAKLTEFKKALADYIEGKNVARPEEAGDASVYINSFEKVLLAEQNELSEFKGKIAEAITEKGVETSEDADADTMANNIKSISINNEKEEYLIGTPYTYTVETGITVTMYSNQQMKMVRSYQAACGIKISEVDLSKYRLIQVKYSSLTSSSLALYAGELSTQSTTSSGTIELDITEIETIGNVTLRLVGKDGSVFINSLKLIP